MARDRQSWYLTWGGQLGTSEEIWQTGVHLASTAPGDTLSDPTQSYVDAYADAIETMHTDSDCGIGFHAKLSWARVSRQGLDGKDLGPPAIFEFATPVNGAGASAAQIVAWQLAFVVSLRSGSTFGQANYGRMYMPQPMFAVASDGHVGMGPDTVVTYSVLIEQLNAIATDGVGGNPIVVSNMSAVGTGTTKEVTQVQIGNVLDTQRRRRNGLTEAYQVATVD